MSTEFYIDKNMEEGVRWVHKDEQKGKIMQKKQTTEQKVKEIIAAELSYRNVKAKDIKLTDLITKNLGADSLDKTGIIMACEEAFGISIYDDEAELIDTVQELIDHVDYELRRSPAMSDNAPTPQSAKTTPAFKPMPMLGRDLTPLIQNPAFYEIQIPKAPKCFAMDNCPGCEQRFDCLPNIAIRLCIEKLTRDSK